MSDLVWADLHNVDVDASVKYAIEACFWIPSTDPTVMGTRSRFFWNWFLAQIQQEQYRIDFFKVSELIYICANINT